MVRNPHQIRLAFAGLALALAAPVACAAATKSALEVFTTETGAANVVMGILPCTAPPGPA